MSYYEFKRGKDKKKRARRGFGQRLANMKKTLGASANKLKAATKEGSATRRKGKMLLRGAEGEARLLAGQANRAGRDAIQKGKKAAGTLGKNVRDKVDKLGGRLESDGQKRRMGASKDLDNAINMTPLTNKNHYKKAAKGVANAYLAAGERKLGGKLRRKKKKNQGSY